MDHRTAAGEFRGRLERVLARSRLSQAGFARRIGVDRSTLSQLLSPDNDRLPRAETLVAIAGGCGVSVDWLLGLSQSEAPGAEMVQALLTFEPQAHAPFDERTLAWLAEAGGRPVRTVPVTFPDFLKTEETMAFEYEAALGPPHAAPTAVLAERRRRMEAAIREGGTLEACASIQALDAFARGQGQWAGLPAEARGRQLDALAHGLDELYPAFRLYLYDARTTYSAPFTVFGTGRAAVYLGPTYLVLNASEHIRLLSRRFDELIRAARVQPHEAAAHVAGLRGSLDRPAATA